MDRLNRKAGVIVLRWGLTLVVAAVILIPLFWIFISSITPKTMLFQTPVDYWPDTPTLENYIDIFTGLNFMKKAGNTLLITFAAMALAIGLPF